MIGRVAGFFLVLAGAFMAAGTLPNWVTLHVDGTARTYSAFTIVPNYRDAIVSLSIAAALVLFGLVLTMIPLLLARGLGTLAGLGAAVWAGLLYFSLLPQVHSLIAPPAAAPNTVIDEGLLITAAAGFFGLIAATLCAMARPRKVLLGLVARPLEEAELATTPPPRAPVRRRGTPRTLESVLGPANPGQPRPGNGSKPAPPVPQPALPYAEQRQPVHQSPPPQPAAQSHARPRQAPVARQPQMAPPPAPR
ncbi:MAG: hypothetical protein ACREN2_04250, partial [Candidatus Dormibacteria bacterium]